MKVIIKDWFLNKLQENNAFFSSEAEIIKETEKAYFLDMEGQTADGEHDVFKKAWVPKSCTMTPEEAKAEREAEIKRFEEGKAAYEKMVAWAKEKGIKGVRIGLRKATILRKIKEAGLAYEG